MTAIEHPQIPDWATEEDRELFEQDLVDWFAGPGWRASSSEAELWCEAWWNQYEGQVRQQHGKDYDE